MNAYTRVSTRQTKQCEPIPGKAMAQNNAGGFTFQVDDWARLDRFLILGSEGNTYYCTEREMTKQNAECVIRCIKADGARTVRRIVEISDSGRAPKNDPALFALAMCAGLGDEPTRHLAMTELPKVARIGTHLFHFAEFVKQFRGRGKLFKRGIQAWYENKEISALAYQMVKYQGRDGWTHRDLLRLAKPKTEDTVRNSLYEWVVGKADVDAIQQSKLPMIWAFEWAKRGGAKTTKEKLALIREYNLPRECLPTEWLTEPDVWEALLEKMPMTAMIRNLATMTRVGLIAPMSQAAGKVISVLGDRDIIHKARVHPVAILAALKTYAQGHGERGRKTWTPVPQVIDALDDAFYAAFDNVQPTGKRFYLGLDVSGSMGVGQIAAIPGLTPRLACGAMAMVTVRTEKQYYSGAFTGKIVPLALSAKQRLDDVCNTMSRLPFGITDCSLPMLDATQRKMPVDVFIVYTDSETWSCAIHPCQALQQYRRRMGIAAKLIVVGMTATKFSIADPNDGGMLDVVGFDTVAPELIRDFAL